jgi:uncharacterized protein YegP (UPF0339 family)
MRFEIYQGTDRQWYWHLKSRNNKVIADSAEAYVSKSNAVRAVRTVRTTLTVTYVPIEIRGEKTK